MFLRLGIEQASLNRNVAQTGVSAALATGYGATDHAVEVAEKLAAHATGHEKCQSDERKCCAADHNIDGLEGFVLFRFKHLHARKDGKDDRQTGHRAHHQLLAIRRGAPVLHNATQDPCDYHACGDELDVRNGPFIGGKVACGIDSLEENEQAQQRKREAIAVENVHDNGGV